MVAPRTVLLITFHFPPSAASGAFRLLGFARHLPKFGWKPIVIAPPSLPWEPVDPELDSQVPAEMPVIHVPYPRGLIWKLPRRLAPYEIWLPRAWEACARAIRRFRPEAVLTSGPPHCLHRLGLSLKRRYHLPWIADFRDPWMATISTRKPWWRRWWDIRGERQVMQQADLIVANAPQACCNLQAAFPAQGRKMVAITNGFDPDFFPSSAPPPNGSLRIVHAGEIYAGRDPRPFLDAVRNLTESPAVRVSFLGQADGLMGEIQRRGLESQVEVTGQVSYGRAVREMAEAGILLLLDSPGRRQGVPAKLYEYLGTGRPIMALAEPEGDVAWVLKESGVPHRLAAPGDFAGIRQGLAELVELARQNPGTGGLRPGAGQFTRERVAQQLAQSLDQCLESV